MSHAPHEPPALPSNRKSAILFAAMGVFSEKGVEASTIEDIRQRCQASVGSIYHHFGTKEGIAAALYSRALDSYWNALDTAAASAGDAKTAVHRLVQAHMEWIVSQPVTARFLFARRQAVQAPHEQPIRQQTLAHFKRMFERFRPWFQQGVLRRMAAELYGPLLLGPAQELARHWLEGGLKSDPRQLVKELSRAAWCSVAVDPLS